MHTAPVARRGCPAGGPVVAADGKQPVLARRVLFAQDFRSDGEVAVRVQQLAGLRVAMRVVAEIDLAEAGVDAIGRRVGERTVQPRAGLGAGGVALWRAGDVERPRPGDQAPAQHGAALLQGHRVQHRRRHVCTMRRQLIGRRRHFPRQGGQRPAAGGEQQRGAGAADGDAGWPTLPARSTYCRCHWPFTSRTTAGRSPGRPSDSQRPASWLSVMVRARTLAGSMPAWVAHCRMRASS